MNRSPTGTVELWLDRLYHQRGSIFGRSTGLFLFFIPGLAFNYALIYLASRYLEPAPFGILYTAFTIINVLVAPAFILNMFFARQFTVAAAGNDTDAVRLIAHRAIRRVAMISGVGGMVVLAVMLGFGELIRVTAGVIIVLIVAQALLSYPAEVIRSYLQGTQQFFWVGMFGLSWLALRFTFGAVGLFVVTTAWGVIAGTVAAALVIVLAGTRLAFGAPERARAAPTPSTPNLRTWLNFSAAYGLVILIAHADVLLAYLLVDRVAAGVYAASSVLPKAIFLLLTPIIQVSFVALSSERLAGGSGRAAFAKTLGMTVGCGVVAGLGLFALSDYVCGGAMGIAHCQPALMNTLAIGAIGASVIRILVMRELADRRDRQPLLLVLPLAIYGWAAIRSNSTLGDFAENYVVFALASLAAYTVMCIVLDVVRKRQVHTDGS